MFQLCVFQKCNVCRSKLVDETMPVKAPADRNLKQHGGGCSVYGVHNLSDQFLGETRVIANCSHCTKGRRFDSTVSGGVFATFELILPRNLLSPHGRLDPLELTISHPLVTFRGQAFTRKIVVVCGVSQQETPSNPIHTYPESSPRGWCRPIPLSTRQLLIICLLRVWWVLSSSWATWKIV